MSGLPRSIAESGPEALRELRRLRLRELIRQHPAELEADLSGQPIRRGVLIVVDPDPESLQLAARAGFRIMADKMEPELGIRSVTLAIPPKLSTRKALVRLQSVAPRLQADFDHVYEPSGGELLPFAGALALSQGGGAAARIGISTAGSHRTRR